MIETKKVTVEITRNKVCSIRCNKCGEEMITECSPTGRGINVNYEAGYDSKIHGDGVTVSFDLCEVCIKDLMDGFCIPAQIKNRYVWEEDE